MTDEQLEILDIINLYVLSGFYNLEDITDFVFEQIEEDYTYSKPWVISHIEKAYEAHLKASQTWQSPTDPEKLRIVFDQLCQEGILALHNYGGEDSDFGPIVAEVIEELEEDEYQIQIKGYCGYHFQEIERVLMHKKLYISFHSLNENELENKAEQLAIGHRLTTLLREQGLNVIWDASKDDKVRIDAIKWLKVFVNDEDAWDEYRIFDLVE